MKRLLLTTLVLALAAGSLFAGNDNEKSEDGVIAVPLRKDEIIKTGWNFGVLPAFNYNNDLGFQAGVLGQIYHYGDGSDYPNYRHKFTVLASIYSKGAKQFSLDYDSKHLLEGKRVTAHAEYMDNPLCGFYGFNGAVSPYYSALDLRKSEDGSEGIAFYANYQRKFMASLELQGRLGENLTWLGGAEYSFQRYSDVSIDPYSGAETLYHQYVSSGLIPEEDTWGHRVAVKAGAVYDTRDFEAAPERGIYASVTGGAGTSFSSSRSSSLSFSMDFRQYVPVIPSRLVLAYQLGCNTLVAGTLPFHALPAFSMRGSFGSRIAGAGVAWASADLRLRVASFNAFKQNFELGLVGFADTGAVIRPYKLEEQSALGSYTISKMIEGRSLGTFSSIFDPDIAVRERLHSSVGGGFFFSMNKNFITAVEFGRPFNPQDGSFGVYINLGFSF
ncbi:MAG: BamA/TamA family outer membrane protein [Bacteroidales bacterium]|nr:BamA/TamA family outer membrane protein [Bacteroidales bacterium]